MKTVALVLLFIGALFALSGFVFALQGLGVVGPSSSFMYQNGSWIVYGIVIFVLGLGLLLTGYRSGLRFNK